MTINEALDFLEAHDKQLVDDYRKNATTIFASSIIRYAEYIQSILSDLKNLDPELLASYERHIGVVTLTDVITRVSHLREE